MNKELRLLNFIAILSGITFFLGILPYKIGTWFCQLRPQNCHGDDPICLWYMAWPKGLFAGIIGVFVLAFIFKILQALWEIAGEFTAEKKKEDNPYIRK